MTHILHISYKTLKIQLQKDVPILVIIKYAVPTVSTFENYIFSHDIYFRHAGGMVCAPLWMDCNDMF